MKKLIIIIFFLAMVTASGVSAQLPKTINYQGVLTNSGGAVVPDGDYSITFRLYTVSTGGSSVWDCAETVTVTKGIFNVTLGITCALALPFDTQYYLGISVEAEAELLPRTALAASAYSINSLAVTGIDNFFPATGNVGIGTAAPSGKLEIFYDNLMANNPAIQIDNNTMGGQDLITFAFDALPQASLRKANGGDFYLSSTHSISLHSGGSTRMRVLSSGNVGIGNTMPAELLDVNGGIKLGTSSGTNAGTMRWSGSDFEGYDGGSWQSLTSGGSSLPSGTAGQTLRHDGTNWTANSLLTNDGTNIDIGSTTQDGILRVYADGSAYQIAKIDTWLTHGGAMSIYDELGASTIELQADANGEGGYFRVKRNAASSGFVVNGNYANESPLVSIDGASSSADFNMGVTGDASVVLPASSISSSEMFNEPGAASNCNDYSVNIGALTTVILSRSITVPAGGYVLVMSTLQLTIAHINGAYSRAVVGVSDISTSLPTNQDIMVGLPDDLPTDTYQFPVSAHGLFEVASAGTYTYYLLGELHDTEANFAAWDQQLTLVYIPTNYGTVTPTLAGSGSGSDEDIAIGKTGLTASDIAFERRASIADNDARVQRELNELRAEIEALKRDMNGNKE